MIDLVGMMILAILGDDRFKFKIFVDLLSGLWLDFHLYQVVKIVLPNAFVLEFEVHKRTTIFLIDAREKSRPYLYVLYFDHTCRIEAISANLLKLINFHHLFEHSTEELI